MVIGDAGWENGSPTCGDQTGVTSGSTFGKGNRSFQARILSARRRRQKEQ